MTCGIYQLTFQSANMYIGQSVDVETRWKQHFDKFRKGTAAKNMQYEFRRSGFPATTLLAECHPDHLDMLESMYIHARLEQFPTYQILNTSIPKKYNESDVTFVTSHAQYLKNSLIQLMRKVEIGESNIEALEEEVESLRDEGLVMPSEIREIQSNNRQLEQQVSKLITINQELSRRANMTWFERLFS